MSRYPEEHWAFQRERCPACGGALRMAGQTLDELPLDRYDSSADIRFDLSSLLTAEAAREARLVGWLGIGLILLAFLGRLGFVYLARTQGIWDVPLWLELLVLGALVLGLGMAFWGVRRLLGHRRAIRRG
jgi:uncharacterized membrane protein YhdT